jgi:hypothetical protein
VGKTPAPAPRSIPKAVGGGKGIDLDDAEKRAVDSVLTVLESLSSDDPYKYVLSYDHEENANGITKQQLTNALFKVTKGRDKGLIIGLGSSKELLMKYASREGGRLWVFDSKTGMLGSKTAIAIKAKKS